MYSFGTYHLHGTALSTALKNLFEITDIRHIDTAALYKNEAEIGQFLKNNKDLIGEREVLITTKIWDTKLRSIDMIIRSIVSSINKLKGRTNDSEKSNHYDSSNLRFRMLLHHPAPPHVWKALESCVEMGLIHEIGVSNHNIEALESLLSYANITPCINQLEVHPFLDPVKLQPLLGFCKTANIPVQAHSALMRGLYWSDKELVKASKRMELTQAQYLIAWVGSQKGVKNICISSTNPTHFQELIATPIPKEPITSITGIKRSRLYPLKDPQPLTFGWTIEELASTIKKDMEKIRKYNTNWAYNGNPIFSNTISDVSLMIPSVNSKYSSIGRDVARCVYPDLEDDRRFKKFHALTKPLRVFCDDRFKEREEIERKKGLSMCCVTKKVKNFDDQISDAIINPTPMPVDVSEKETLEPFLNYLSSDEPLTTDKEFFKGAVIDKRMDMCKQVTGPDHIGALCESVSKNTQIKHFLLGNNIAFKDDQQKAHSMAKIMKSNQDIETWYLAGNYIGEEAISILSEGLYENTTCKSLWLKRNPIGPIGAKHLNKMLYNNINITLLDLDNCGLLDEGVENLLAESPLSLKMNLKHLYLDANGITESSAPTISQWCEKHKHQLKSIYLSINRLGDDGVRMICDSLRGSKTLKRFSVGSNRLTRNLTEFIVDFSLSCPNLICLGLGCYKSTYDLGEKPNFFSNIEPFIQLIQNHESLQYLDLLMNCIKHDDIIKLIEVAKELKRSVPLTIDGCQNGTKPEERKDLYFNGHKDRSCLKFIKHPKKVLHIDSIYRNRM